jgi:replicative DNA helicase
MKTETKALETSIIGAILLNPETSYEIITRLSEGYFSEGPFKDTFKIISGLHSEGRTVNLLTVTQESRKHLDEQRAVEVRSLVLKASNAVSIHEPILEYISELKEAYIARSVTNIITDRILSTNSSGTNLATEIIKSLTDLIDSNTTDEGVITPAELVDFERKLYYEQAEIVRSGKLIGVDTGLKCLNDFTGGWQPELIVLAGRPGMGKTACALFHGLSTGDEGIYINCEMSKSQLAQRLILNRAKGSIDGRALKKRTLDQDSILNYERAIGLVEKTKLNTYYKPACGVFEAIRVIKRAHRKGQCKWAIIDYLQLLQYEGPRAQSREQEVSNIIKLLKRLQLELNIPIIVLAQISRAVEQRQSRKPILSDLRESGEIEQTADTVVFIWRPGYYGIADESGKEYTNEMFYLFEKHRQGSVGYVEFRHNETLTDFYDIDYSISTPVLTPPATSTPMRHWTDTEKWDIETDF